MEKIIPSILAAFLPLLVAWFSKKSKDNIRKSVLEDAQKKIDFLNNYFEVQKKLKTENEIDELKVQLSGELVEVKNKISLLDRKEEQTGYQKLGVIQKLFLTFIPASAIGWLWSILFYIDLFFVFFFFLGSCLDDLGNFSAEVLLKNMQDTDTILGMGFFLLILLLFRWLALLNYRKKSTLHTVSASA